MPGLDQYYNSLAKNGMTRQSGAADVKPDPSGIGPAPANMMAGNENAGQQGGSPYDSGSGFINLSHLLSLNGASGQASARQAADNINKQGKAAQGAIQTAEDKFNKQAESGTVKSGNVLPGGGDGSNGDLGGKSLAYYQQELAKANQGYQGPNSLSDTAGYGNLSKQVSSAQGRAQNATTGNGEASQIGQDTGLSPKQAAAAAFYQGVSNPYLAEAGNNFKNLGGMLDQANARSVNAADQAQQITANSAQDIGNYVNNVQNYWNNLPSNSVGPNGTLTGPAADGGDQTDRKRKGGLAAGTGWGALSALLPFFGVPI